ncbi:MAG TPA: patatin-like phospholipase family protein [Hyphomicrobiaceae bacterium]|nr:patatin-like phospholipase family protein [Hyphomicrobiaceae bacterium]
MIRRRAAVRLNLALQGGGAHGAFTWGVLDRLLEERDITFCWLSGTSAGAINAVAVASGLATGGQGAARDQLNALWHGVIESGVPDLMRLNPFLWGMSRASPVGQMTSMFSPYEFNPLGFDPLRKLIGALIDFDRLRAYTDIELLIAATDVATGRVRLFRRRELTVDAVLASTCLPTLHHAVEIDGRAYWDGGFSANPDIVTLAGESPASDTLIVQLNPIEKAGVPRTARAIAFDVNRITFTQPFLRDVAEIAALKRDAPRSWLFSRNSRTARIARHRFHLIEAARHTGDLAPETKLRPERALLMFLHRAGREEAGKWLARHRQALGKHATVDLESRFLGPLGPLATTATAERDDDPDTAVLGGKL